MKYQLPPQLILKVKSTMILTPLSPLSLKQVQDRKAKVKAKVAAKVKAKAKAEVKAMSLTSLRLRAVLNLR